MLAMCNIWRKNSRPRLCPADKKYSFAVSVCLELYSEMQIPVPISVMVRFLSETKLPSLFALISTPPISYLLHC